MYTALLLNYVEFYNVNIVHRKPYENRTQLNLISKLYNNILSLVLKPHKLTQLNQS